MKTSRFDAETRYGDGESTRDVPRWQMTSRLDSLRLRFREGVGGEDAKRDVAKKGSGE